MDTFELVCPYKPTGDQPQAIQALIDGFNDGAKSQVLLGVTGSGKTFTMANVIAGINRPALVLAHNKTLAAQLCNEFREFFPHNRVEFFVSYYDYYQPEAYIVSSDTYIEKDMAINDEIDKLRHSATCSLHERRDTIVVASVSCIYGLGAPEEYYRLSVSLRPGMTMDRDELIRRLVAINYKRNDIEFERTNFRVQGDTVDIFTANNSEIALRVEFFGDEIDTISEFEAVSGKVVSRLNHAAIFPASHYAVEQATMNRAIEQILRDLDAQEKFFTDKGLLIEAQRIRQRVNYDVEMMREVGYCNGIENYSRYFDGRVLVTTLTKKMSESLTAYLGDNGVRVRYLHSDIGTMERIEIVNALRAGEFDVVVGINLLREGLDIPEVKLVAILDADKEGFLRSDTAIIQTVGRAARNSESRVILYADTITGSMRRAIDETERRRAIQMRYNAEHNITPRTIVKPITNTIEITAKADKKYRDEDIPEQIEKLKALMRVASASLDFETAIKLRDEIAELKKMQTKITKAKRGKQ